MFEQAIDLEVMTRDVIQDQCLRGIHIGLHDLIDQCNRDDLKFLCVWFNIIQEMLSVRLRRIRDEVIKMIPMMLDIAENALWGVADCC